MCCHLLVTMCCHLFLLSRVCRVVGVVNSQVVEDLASKMDMFSKDLVGDMSSQEDTSSQRLVGEITSQGLVGDLTSQRLLGDMSNQGLVEDMSNQRLVGDMSSQRLVADFSSQTFLLEPADQTVIRGQRVILPCRLNYKSRVQWTKDGFGLGQDRMLPGFETLTMVGTDLDKDWDLEIYPVQPADEALYQCQVLGAWQQLRSRVASLVVTSPSQPPLLSPPGPLLVTREGEEASLSCQARGGRPAAKIRWETGLVVVEKVDLGREEEEEEAGTFTSVSSIHFTPLREWEGASLECRVGTEVVSILLRVHHRPRVQVSWNQGGGQVEEGDSVTSSCLVTSRPPATNLSWELGGLRVGEGPSVTLEQVSRQDNSKRLVCRASNSVGEDEASLTLSVLYVPKLTLQPSSVLARPGDQILGVGPTLSVVAEENTEDFYYCQVRADKYPPVISHKASLALRRIPDIVSPKIQYGVLHSDTELECEGSTSPDSNITTAWFLLEVPIVEGTRYTRGDKSSEGHFRSSLTVHNTSETDLLTYTCRVTNEVGRTELDILLVEGEIPGSLRTLRLVLGVGGAISCLLVLGVGCWFCRNVLNNIARAGEDDRVSEAGDVATELLPLQDVPLPPPQAPKDHLPPSPPDTLVLHNIRQDFAAFYGNPHLSPNTEEEVGVLSEATEGETEEFAAFYGNPRLSHYVRETQNLGKEGGSMVGVHSQEGGSMVGVHSQSHGVKSAVKSPRESVGTKPKTVNFNPEAQVLNVVEEVDRRSHPMSEESVYSFPMSVESVFSEDIYSYSENAFLSERNMDVDVDDDDITVHSESV